MNSGRWLIKMNSGRVVIKGILTTGINFWIMIFIAAKVNMGFFRIDKEK